MKLDKLKSNWEDLGECDPFWAVLTDPSKINNKWDVDDFFESWLGWVIIYLRNYRLMKK